MIFNYTITPQQAQFEAYKSALSEEIHTGQQVTVKLLTSRRIDHPLLVAYRARILGGLSNCTHYAEWTKFLLKEYGPQKRCLSLGSGLGRVEKYLVETGFAQNMETIDASAGVNVVHRSIDGRIAWLKDDLNFIELQEGEYDFVLCHGVLHHLINLEHVLEQVNASLRRDGLFLVYEYVGDNRWQFSEQRLNLLRQLFPSVSIASYPRWKVGGFESIRSSDLLGLIQAVFNDRTERSVCFGGIYFPFIISTKSAADKYLNEVISKDEELSQNETLTPCYHMGLYRKTNKVPPVARVWSDHEVEARLERGLPPLVKMWWGFKKSMVGQMLRRLKQRST